MVSFTHPLMYSFFHSIQAGAVNEHLQIVPLISLSVWMVPLELGSTQPVQPH